MKTTCLMLTVLVSCLQFNLLFGQKRVNEQLFNHAKMAPDSVAKNFNDLAAYLESPAQNEKEAVETIFYWMAINIRYYEDPSFESADPDSVAKITLLTKQSGCEGTARLFDALCNAAQIECEIIFGFAQGYGYDAKKASRPNHGWNAVKIDNEWLLADATWGSGGATTEGDSLVYVKELDMRYLFADPKNFIIDHFPEDAKWQLLDKPISRREFYSDEYDLKRWAKLGW